MSAREALAVARTSLELIAEVATEEAILKLAKRALAGLDVLTIQDVERRAKDAARKKGARTPKDIRGSPPDVRGVPRSSSSVQRKGEGGVGGGVGSDQDPADLNQDSNNQSSGGGPGEGPAASSGVHRKSADVHPPLQDFGMLVDAWLGGMREATGNAGWNRRAQTLGAIRALEGTLTSNAPAEGDRIDWARGKAVAYVAAQKGGTLSVFAFQSWLQSGEPDRVVYRDGKPQNAPVAPKPIVVTREDEEQAERAYEAFKNGGESTAAAVLAAGRKR